MPTLLKIAVIDTQLHSIANGVLMLKLERVMGQVTDPDLAARLHKLEHTGCVEYITLTEEDTKRRRLRVLTDRGTDCAIALDRDQPLGNGSVLWLDDTRAVVVRLPETQWLTLKPATLHAALELGYFAGNLHWRVEVSEDTLRVAITSAPSAYLERLHPLLASQPIEVIDHG